MDEPGARLWQILFLDGLTRAQVDRVADFAAASGIEEQASGVDERSVFSYSYDRSTVELYRHVFQKAVDGAELSEGDRLTLTDHLDELDRWSESTGSID
ncbi:hypothetical protein [Nocardia sp. NPDC049149]|uniref:hypothetical protein n=1 Tax=Nocardia sp. NPDC049149 TaxID=3364315 RepID=UPI00371765FE